MHETTSRLDVALIHYPVNNKQGDIIGSAVTNLDIHDIARAGRTFGVNKFYIITPFADQKDLVQEILDHWLTGYGASRNPDRKEALSIVEILDSCELLWAKVEEKWGMAPVKLATCARQLANTLEYSQVRKEISEGKPHLLLFGTAWGLDESIFDLADQTLPPICGYGSYNHLSVRSAVSIILDRLVGK